MNGVEIPFQFQLSLQRGKATGAFFNGEDRVSSPAGSFAGDALALRFEQYASTLQASWVDGTLAGTYERPGSRYDFRAVPHVTPAASDARPPKIDAQWKIAVNSPKGESAWRFFVRQSGARISASILRVDGDTGTLEGSYRNGSFVLSHFSGARPLLLQLTLQGDGSPALLVWMRRASR